MYKKLKSSTILFLTILLIEFNFHDFADLSTFHEITESSTAYETSGLSKSSETFVISKETSASFEISKETSESFEISKETSEASELISTLGFSNVVTTINENSFTDHHSVFSTNILSNPPNTVSTKLPDLTTTRPNYCKELFPRCSCLSSPLIIKCNNFNRFNELDFTLLLNGNLSNGSRKIFELELEPLQPLIVDENLNLTGIELNDRVTLRNINGFDINSNPFQKARTNKTLNLFLYNSKIEFYSFVNESEKINLIDNCRLDFFGEDFIPLFSSFNYIFLGRDVRYSKLCPLIFKNSNIRLIEFNSLNSTNMVLFVNLTKNNQASQLNCKIQQVRIFDARSFTLDDSFLNSDVFKYLDSLNFDYVSFKKIEDNAFRNLNSLRTLIINIENMEQFITSSNNTWMKYLNNDIKIDYNKTDLNISDYYNKSLLITINNRNNNQNYSYPSKDLKHFQYFPHENYVFLRILSEVNLECSTTIQFILKYATYYRSPQTLNTTSVNKCLLSNQVTTSISTTYFSTTIQSEGNKTSAILQSTTTPVIIRTTPIIYSSSTIKTEFTFSTGAYIGRL